MKASSSVPNMRTMPRVSTTSIQGSDAPLQNTKTTQPNPSIGTPSSYAPNNGAVQGMPNVSTLTGLENTEGNFASSYVPPNETILAEYAFAEDIYKKNKRKYQRMLVAPALQHLILDGNADTEDAQILLKP